MQVKAIQTAEFGCRIENYFLLGSTFETILNHAKARNDRSAATTKDLAILHDDSDYKDGICWNTHDSQEHFGEDLID